MLSLAIPNFNGGRFLATTLESLENNRPYVRWRFQDAGSTDDSLAIARRFAGSQDQIIVEPDRGQADALNRAFQSMGGEIVGFINSDDCLMEGTAKTVLAEFENDPTLDLVYGQVAWIDELGHVTGHHAGDISSLAEILDIYRVWWNRRQWVQPEVFWRRSLWERVGPFNTRYDLAFDYDYWVRCFQARAKVKSIPQILAKFRLHPGQKSSRAGEAANEIRNIVGDTLASGEVIPTRDRKRLETMISYDRYQSGQDDQQGTKRPSLARMLMRQPTWAFLPPVRQRIVRSALRAFSAR
ncbi:MAG: glycosyltransferase family 2 protein [Bryobacteraceae bacterium]